MQRADAVIHGMKAAPVCPVCKKGKLRYRGGGKYSKVCSNECAAKIVGKLSSEAVQKKYGVKNVTEIEGIRKKISKAVRASIASRRAKPSRARATRRANA